MRRMLSALGAVFEQAAYTAVQFGINVALARSMDVAGYGLVAVVLSLVVFINIFYVSFLHEPSLIEGMKVRVRFSIEVAVLTVVPVTAGSILYLYGHGLSTSACAAAAVLFASYTAYWVLRTVGAKTRGYTGLLVCHTLIGGGVAMIGLASSAQKESAVMLMLAASILLPTLLAAAAIRRNGRIEIIPGRPASPRKWLGFGASSASAQLMSWLVGPGLVVLLGSLGHFADSAKFRILLTVLLPAQYVLMALGYHLMPRFAASFRQDDAMALTRMSVLFVLGGAALAGGLSVLLLLFGDALVVMLFGAAYGDLDVRFFSLFPVVFAVVMCLRTLLKSFGMARAVFLAAGIGLLAGIGLGAWRYPQLDYLVAAQIMLVSFLAIALVQAGALATGVLRRHAVR
ncbi:polysaccharide efflux transporter [Cupriavidus sp. AcVe19-6a]|uniref:polysaccharide efflux transporter n=1 Tax=Cupriavidus sp. AcVe19-6a TaxID=2821358 RepID=UPI001AE4FA72|nr:polysaccharide efflux transporter [Cupriavidus sp. AcVe19-6a]MBP0639556.1 polysaccharide efflux transporter [Cupriavidus sp. AcVe19-6a]